MLEMRNISLQFGSQPVLQGLDLTLNPGQRMGLIGPSGVGKSSLLRLACGLQSPSAGQVMNRFTRSILLFQEPRLLPWRTVLENLLLPLRELGHSAKKAQDLAIHWLEQVELAPNVVNAWPRELSGGMAQRVALARALALAPDLLLLDEPFSALDPALRSNLTQVCTRVLEQSQTALLCVSHHPQELQHMVDACWQVTPHGLLHAGSISTSKSMEL